MTPTGRFTRALSALLLSSGVIAGTATAAPETFLQLSGIAGEHAQAPYKTWSSVSSPTFSVGRSVLLSKGGGEEIGPVKLSGLGWTQPVDTTYPQLLGNLLTAKPVDEVLLHLVVDTRDGPFTQAQLRLQDAYVTQIALQNGEFRGEVSAGRVGFGFKPLSDRNVPGKQRNVGYSLKDASSDDKISTAFSGYTIKGSAPPPAPKPTGDRIFMRHDALSEAGASNFVGYENWSEVFGVSWLASAEIGFGGAGGGLTIGKAKVGEFVWTQALDNAAVDGLHDFFTTERNGQLVFEFVRDAGGGPVTYMQIALADAYFNSWALDDRTIMQSVAFSRIVQTVWAIKPDGSRGKSVSVGWDATALTLIDNPAPVGANANFGAGGLTGVSAVPEPQTALLFGVGLLALARLRRQRPGAL